MQLKHIAEIYEFTGSKRKVISALRSEGFVVHAPVQTFTGQEYAICNNGNERLGRINVGRAVTGTSKGDTSRSLTIEGQTLSVRLQHFAENYRPK